MVGTGSPVSFRRRPPLALRGGPDCQSSATVFTPVWAHVSAWGPARHDNHEGQRMTPGAPTDGARSRFPGHRDPAEAGTTHKDSGQRPDPSKGLRCGSPLIDEAGMRCAHVASFVLSPPASSRARCLLCDVCPSCLRGTRRARRRLPEGPSPTGEPCSVSPEVRVPSGWSRIGHSSTVCAPTSSIEADCSTATTASALRAR